MILKTITMRNFRCFYGEQTLHFATDPKKNVTLIYAENGVGKTTILNALTWCFYGDTTQRFELKDEIINYDALTQDEHARAEVEIEFTFEGKHYKAFRLRTAGGKDVPLKIWRLDDTYNHTEQPQPELFIERVMPREMAPHFMFDGEHAEVFSGEHNRTQVRRAIRDILGCRLLENAIEDCTAAEKYYATKVRQETPDANEEQLTGRIIDNQAELAIKTQFREEQLGRKDKLKKDIQQLDVELSNFKQIEELNRNRLREENRAAQNRANVQKAATEKFSWFGQNMHNVVSEAASLAAEKILNDSDIRGQVPAPYNKEFVDELLEKAECICGRPIHPGSDENRNVRALLEKSATVELRSRVTKVRARVSELADRRKRAPNEIASKSRDFAGAEEALNYSEQELAKINEKLNGVDEEAIKRANDKRNSFSSQLEDALRHIGGAENGIKVLNKAIADDNRALAAVGANTPVLNSLRAKKNFASELSDLFKESLETEEEAARKTLQQSVQAIVDEVARKELEISLREDFSIEVRNNGRAMPKSSGENQLIGLSFTAALTDFSKSRADMTNSEFLRGTVAPLVLDSPFGQLDVNYRRGMARHLPEMANQVVFMLSQSQGSTDVLDELADRIGEEAMLVRHNKGKQVGIEAEYLEIGPEKHLIVHNGADFDGTEVKRMQQ